MAKGWSVTTASRKMIVSPASRMLSAISFGVFWRSAPSTSAIIRSRKVSPGFDEVREQHGEPQPNRHEAHEHTVRRPGGWELLEEQHCREHAPDLHDEHHGIARHLAGVELHERVADRPAHDRRVEHRRGRGAL